MTFSVSLWPLTAATIRLFLEHSISVCFHTHFTWFPWSKKIYITAQTYNLTVGMTILTFFFNSPFSNICNMHRQVCTLAKFLTLHANTILNNKNSREIDFYRKYNLEVLNTVLYVWPWNIYHHVCYDELRNFYWVHCSFYYLFWLLVRRNLWRIINSVRLMWCCIN